MLLNRKTKGVCWICGATEILTGEHKIKKSDLLRFPIEKPWIHKVETQASKKIQGLNSKYLKFQHAICARCNNEGTQKADRSYDAFWNKDLEPLRFVSGKLRFDNNLDHLHHFELAERTDLARYFGKHLGCALDYEKFPVPRRLSRFVGGSSDEICISLSMRCAPYQSLEDEAGKVSPIAGIGGAILQLSNPPFLFPEAYVSSFMTGGVQFAVEMRLSLLEAIEIRIIYQKSMGAGVRQFCKEESKLRGVQYDD